MGPKRAELLNKELEIYTLDDLVHYFPYKYIDRSRFYQISEIDSTAAYIQIKGQILGFKEAGKGRAQRLIAIFTDGHSSIELIFFKGIKYVMDAYHLNTDYIVFGKPNFFNGNYSFVHPDIEKPTPDSMTGFMPLYHTTEKMKNKFLNSKAIQKLIYTAVKQMDKAIPETLPEYIISKYHLMDLYTSLVQVHFPQNMNILDKARYRLKFEELFYIQLAILRQANVFKSKVCGHEFKQIGKYFNSFYHERLPFELTEAQKRVLREIREDVRNGKQMNRLLQGDVGSGKTIVALLSMLMAVDNGFQACIVAPTEILATQHYEEMCSLLEGIGVEIRLLTGSTKKKAREELHAKLRDGSLSILVGTHAILEDCVVFKDLGLVVIDEQHRFGVAQRARLWAKNLIIPHVLVMTATPIPRTLAMTLYGDLDVSVIDELPPGRKPVQTDHIYEDKRGLMYRFLRRQMEAGRQIYVVFPLIQESEKSDLKDLESGFESLSKEFSEFAISMVHGKMKPAEKDAEMQKFVSGETKMLVATTVIEVGVNVPNASVMVIENAERFGLSQLHQLRGRVGRGAEQSFCLLMTKYELSSDTRKRIDIMTETNDGFLIAETDLKLRGPGDLEGTMQSGLPFDLRIADLTKDGPILQTARDAASAVLAEDIMLSSAANSILSTQLKKRSKEIVNWSAIS
ncbi:MAG: ATP-dependent DNA helicase RecG [Bacteroidetes bacterium ADurb.Bin302]|nr:MAG: ATP-dependent DNA helicase RecG [Bacteroidetes bacterium ADurb.Bin302]